MNTLIAAAISATISLCNPDTQEEFSLTLHSTPSHTSGTIYGSVTTTSDNQTYCDTDVRVTGMFAINPQTRQITTSFTSMEGTNYQCPTKAYTLYSSTNPRILQGGYFIDNSYYVDNVNLQVGACEW